MANTQPLTARQQEVLDLWLDNVPYRELAERLNIRPGTVSPHLKQISAKLGVHGTARENMRRGAAEYAAR